MCFRWEPRGWARGGGPDRDLLNRMHADGRIFVTATILDGRFWIRPSANVFRNHLERADEFLATLLTLLAD